MMRLFSYVVQLLDHQLWEAPSSQGLHPCVKPTNKYKGTFFLSDCFLVFTLFQSLLRESWASTILLFVKKMFNK